MTITDITTYISRLENKRYTTGVMHISPPEWLEDLRWCIKAIKFLLEELEGEGR